MCGSRFILLRFKLRRVWIVAVPSSGPSEVRQSVPGDVLSSKASPGDDSGGGGGGDHHGDTRTDALVVIIRQPPLSKTATGQGKWSWTADLK